MNLLFAFSAHFIRDGTDVYSEWHFGAAIWQRYLAHFDHVVVAGLQGKVPNWKKASELELASRDGVSFELFSRLSSARGLLVDRYRQRPRMSQLVQNADAVIARLPSEVGFLAIDCAQRIGKPWAVEMVACPWDGLWHYGTVAGKLYAPLAWLRTRQAVRNAPYALYVTERFLQGRYPCPNGTVGSASNVSLPKASALVLERRLKRIEDGTNRPLRLGLIGSLRTRAKGLHIAMEAIANIRKRVPPFTFHILGGGDKQPWEGLAEQHGIADLVHLEGTLHSGEPVLRWLDEIDIYLQPSLQEGLPRALIEAMSRGCPALGSRKAGIPELLFDDDLAPPGDAYGLATLLQRRLGDQEWMVERARHNWEAALRFQAEALDEQRARFWRSFATSLKILRDAELPPSQRSSPQANI